MCMARAIGKQYRTMYCMYVVHTITLAERQGVGAEGGRGNPRFWQISLAYSNQRAYNAHYITSPLPPRIFRPSTGSVAE